MINIECMVCGLIFDQEANSHMRGSGCPVCGRKKAATSRNKGHPQFLIDCNNVHGDKYMYLTDYVGAFHKIKIKCNTCGMVFEQTPDNHVNGGQGCPDCARIRASRKQSKSQNVFDREAFEIHGDHYSYLSPYINTVTYIKMECNVCSHVFEQTPASHIYMKSGCPMCYGTHVLTHDIFVSRSIKMHGDTAFEYVGKYVNNNVKVEILCLTCYKIFTQLPSNHYNRGDGCPYCNLSSGATRVQRFLDEYEITNEIEKRFNTCKDKHTLPFDFYLPDYNVLIEYDGEQHFKPIEFWGGLDGLLQRQYRDQIKTKWCLDNNIPLIRVPYTIPHDNISQFVYDKLCVLGVFP